MTFNSCRQSHYGPLFELRYEQNIYSALDQESNTPSHSSIFLNDINNIFPTSQKDFYTMCMEWKAKSKLHLKIASVTMVKLL